MRQTWIFVIILLIILSATKNVSGQRGPGFSITPNPACVGENITITNTTTGSYSSYLWSFCSANPVDPPVADLLNISPTQFEGPVFTALAKAGNEYFGFVTNHTETTAGFITRIKFGTDILNSNPQVDMLPVVLPSKAEGLQIIYNDAQNTWHGFVTGGQGTDGFFIRIDFGSTLNNSPTTAIFLPVAPSANFPHDLYMFKEGTTWHGIAVNKYSRSLTRYDFNNGLVNDPIATHVIPTGDILGAPVGVFPFSDGNNWYMFVTDTDKGLVRLHFPNGLTQNAVSTVLGTLNGVLKAPRDISLIRYCDEVFGFIVDGENFVDSKFIRLDFLDGITNPPTAVALDHIKPFLNFPHSLSDVIRFEDQIFTLVSNVHSNKITRIFFPSCEDEIPSSTAFQPPPITYGTPGIHTIELIVDIGLPTQVNLCQELYVRPSPTATMAENIEICRGEMATVKIYLTGTPPWSVTYTDGQNPQTIIVNTSPYIFTTTPQNSVSYSVTAVNDAICAGVDFGLPTVITVIPRDDAGFSFANSTYCKNSGPVTPMINTPGGNFTATPPGLVLDPNNGTVTPASSTVNTYTITHSLNLICPDSETFQLSIADEVLADFVYPSSMYCKNAVNPAPEFESNAYAGTFSAIPAGLVFGEDGIIDLLASQPGSYVITNAIDEGSGCPAVSYDFPIEIAAVPQVGFIADTMCFGVGTMLTDTSIIESGTISLRHWFFDDNPLPFPTVYDTLSFVFTQPGLHLVKLVGFSDHGCSNEIVDTIFVKPIPQIDLAAGHTGGGYKTIIACVYDTIWLNAGNPGSDYIWQPSGGTNRLLPVSTSGIAYDVQKHYVTVTNEAGCAVTDSISVVFSFAACTGTGNLPYGSTFKVYPNPAQQWIDIIATKLKGSTELQLVDIFGQTLKKVDLNPLEGDFEIRFSLLDIHEGIYLLRLTGFDFSGTQVVVVMTH